MRNFKSAAGSSREASGRLGNVTILPASSAMRSLSVPGTAAISTGLTNVKFSKAHTVRYGDGGSGEPTIRDVVHRAQAGHSEGLRRVGRFAHGTETSAGTFASAATTGARAGLSAPQINEPATVSFINCRIGLLFGSSSYQQKGADFSSPDGPISDNRLETSVFSDSLERGSTIRTCLGRYSWLACSLPCVPRLCVVLS